MDGVIPSEADTHLVQVCQNDGHHIDGSIADDEGWQIRCWLPVMAYIPTLPRGGRQQEIRSVPRG